MAVPHPTVTDGKISQEDFEKFKKSVVDIATSYAEEHGWCDVVDDALEEMGLSAPWTKCAVKILGSTLPLEIRGDQATTPEKIKEWLKQHTEVAYDGSYIRVEMDYDDRPMVRLAEDGGSYASIRVDEDKVNSILWDTVEVQTGEVAQSMSNQWFWAGRRTTTLHKMDINLRDSKCGRVSSIEWRNEREARGLAPRRVLTYCRRCAAL